MGERVQNESSRAKLLVRNRCQPSQGRFSSARYSRGFLFPSLFVLPFLRLHLSVVQKTDPKEMSCPRPVAKASAVVHQGRGHRRGQRRGARRLAALLHAAIGRLGRAVQGVTLLRILRGIRCLRNVADRILYCYRRYLIPCRQPKQTKQPASTFCRRARFLRASRRDWPQHPAAGRLFRGRRRGAARGLGRRPVLGRQPRRRGRVGVGHDLPAPSGPLRRRAPPAPPHDPLRDPSLGAGRREHGARDPGRCDVESFDRQLLFRDRPVPQIFGPSFRYWSQARVASISK